MKIRFAEPRKKFEKVVMTVGNKRRESQCKNWMGAVKQNFAAQNRSGIEPEKQTFS